MANQSEPERLKQQLGLLPHPSGYGMFRETWRADLKLAFVDNTSHNGPRVPGTCIYFLLEAPNVVRWHRNLSDAAFFWHAGEKVKFHTISQDGHHCCNEVGDVLKHPECAAHVIVPHDTWYATEIAGTEGFCLYSAVVMPGFEFEDWKAGKKEELVKEYPQHEELIARLS